MVKTVYVKKKDNFKDDILKDDLNLLLNLNIEKLITYNRYEVEGLDDDLFEKSIKYIFSEINLDDIFFELPKSQILFAIELLDGQFDQRADSAEKCIALLCSNTNIKIRYTTIYAIEGDLNSSEIQKLKKYLINPVEAKEASLIPRATLKNISKEKINITILDDFINFNDSKLIEVLDEFSLAMDIDDLKLFQTYFINENRNPSLTELKVVDTYWSDHCRHTTFNTIFNDVMIEDDEINKTYNDYLLSKKRRLIQIKPIH